MNPPIFASAMADRIIAAGINFASFRSAFNLLVLLVSGAATAQVTYGPTTGNATTGATLYAACSGCHGASAQLSITIRNAANAGRAINVAMTNGMAGYSAGSYTDTQENDLAAHIATLFVTSPNPSLQAVAHHSAGTAIVLPNVYLSSAFGTYSSISTVVLPSRGSVTYIGTTATYTPTTGQCGTDSFNWRAQGPFGEDTYRSNTGSSSGAIASTSAPCILTSSGTISSTFNSAIATYTLVLTVGTPLG